MKDLEQKGKENEQSNCYSKNSTSDAGISEWYEIVADFLRDLKTEEVTDDKK